MKSNPINTKALRVTAAMTLTLTVASAHAQQADTTPVAAGTSNSTAVAWPSPSPSTRSTAAKSDPAAFPIVIDAVLRDFPNHLRNITGELILAEGEIETYASALALPNAKQCQITRYHSKQDTTVSWQANMVTTDDFAQADRIYKELYQKLQQCYIQLPDGNIIYLKGTWTPAKDGVAFTTSTLQLSVDDQRYRELRVSLELVYQLADWGVNINIFSKKDVDEADPASVRKDFTDGQ